METLLTIPNHHTTPALQIPLEGCTFLSYFEDYSSEQLVFAAYGYKGEDVRLWRSK